MNFSTLSIKNPIPAIVLFILLTFVGLLAFKGSVVQMFPDIELPLVTVNATLQGAAPAQLETEVARKLENAVASLEGIKHIFTTIQDSTVAITIQFELEKKVADALNDVRSAVGQVRSDLPQELLDPIVNKVSTSGQPVVTFTAHSDSLDEQEVSWFVDNTVIKKLLTVTGVGAVNRMGGVDREIRVELDPAKMAALDVSALQVSQQLRLAQQEAPGGRGDVSGAEQNVRTLANVQSVDDLAALALPAPNGTKIALRDVATITDTIAERRSMALFNGKPVVAFEVFRTRGASEIDVATGVQAAIKALQAEYPTIQLQQVLDNTTPVKENFDGSMSTLYEGAFLAVLVVWWFLRDWRATLVVCVALPLSVIPAFLGMSGFGFSLNTVTLLALSLVVGILVDDAIVEIENITRHLRMGKTPLQAATEAADEIGLAVIATTFALIAVFLPTAFMDGIPGKFFKQFGWTAVFAIFASLVVARLLTPMMAAYMLKAQPQHTEEKDGWLMRAYIRSMKLCLKHRLLTAIGAAAFLFGSLNLAGLLPTGFVPASDLGQTQINLELPPGSTLQETLNLSEQARQAVITEPEVKSVFSSVGGGSSGDAFVPGAAAEARRAVLTVTTTHRDAREISLKTIDSNIRQKLAELPGGKFQVGPPDSGVKMQIVLRSENPTELLATARNAERDLRTLKGIGGVSSNASLVRPEIIVRPDFARAADLGVTAASIGETVRVATAGDYANSLPKLNLSERQVPIRVKFPDSVRADLNQIAQLTVPSKNLPVMLSTVASINMESGPAQIKRLDRARNVTLEVELSNRSLGEVYKQAMALPTFKNLPPSVKIIELGDAQEMQKLFASFGLAMGIGVMCIYGVLVVLFKDFLQPITILAALPLSMGGAFVALLVTNSALSMPSMIGLIMLMGVVVKNSILLVEYAIVARRDGMNRFDALVDACHKRSRPIVMTSIAMIAGMLPLALGYGGDPSFKAPMAIAVIGGLVTSTLLSLLVVPAIFTYTDDVEHLLGRLVRWTAKLGQRG
ncbi:MAG: efflux RND transporter permease subunit [Methylococcaceae bacterium]|nr:efflux RND transporter permease subunit [Methylococcaceae bacterium]